jgi:phosphoglycolate phosphatase
LGGFYHLALGRFPDFGKRLFHFPGLKHSGLPCIIPPVASHKPGTAFPPFPMPAAAIFDLDGTLLDTLDDLADSANEALETCGFPPHPVEAYRIFVGDGMGVLIERILPPESRNPETVDRVLRSYRAAYDRRWNAKTVPYPGVEELLAELGHRKVPLGVLSNKPQSYTEICMAHFLGHHPFGKILGQRDAVPRKPDPAGAWEIAAHWALPPREILFVGDTATDMETAVAAGMIPVGVLWGFRSETELRDHGAKHIVTHPGGILNLF